jgi:hypothetical protein
MEGNFENIDVSLVGKISVPLGMEDIFEGKEGTCLGEWKVFLGEGRKTCLKMWTYFLGN